jgi:hypothetical protein
MESRYIARHKGNLVLQDIYWVRISEPHAGPELGPTGDQANWLSMQMAFVERLPPSTQEQEDAMTTPLSTLLTLHNCAQKTMNTPNIYLCITSELNLKAYSPFIAQLPPYWHQTMCRVQSARDNDSWPAVESPKICSICRHPQLVRLLCLVTS